jgi:kynurenine formamidase
MNTPRYCELPVDPKHPPGSSWGVFGADDEVGTLNRQTPGRIRHAATLVHRGVVFPLNWALEQPHPPLFSRQPIIHSLIDLKPHGLDDRYDSFFPQLSSQWDGLSHVEHPRFGFYNGASRAEVTARPPRRLGIDIWARRGIAARFVLADVERFRREHPARARAWFDPADADEIEAILDWQRVEIKDGDVLLLRFGWIRWYEGLDEEKKADLASTDAFTAPGLRAADSTAAWLWDRGFSAIAADCPALEAMPFNEYEEDGYLHYRLVVLLGFAIGELFALDELAADCQRDGVYEGLFVSAPLNKRGGCGSPANALALK